MPEIGVHVLNGQLRLVEPYDAAINHGDYVVYESDDGMGCSRATLVPSLVVIQRAGEPRLRLLRTASAADRAQLIDKEVEELNAYKICREKIAQHSLPMKLVRAVYTFDFNRLTFYFSANGRVDFRSLLRDLTSSFRRTRIMLRQIGVRDEARLIGGMDSCGRTLCCSTFLKEFSSITIKLAKDQGLPPNPHKLSGVCGRLKCCLKYEEDTYLEISEKMPAIGSYVSTPSGRGQVINHFVIRERVQVVVDQELMDFPMDEVRMIHRPAERSPDPSTNPEEQP